MELSRGGFPAFAITQPTNAKICSSTNVIVPTNPPISSVIAFATRPRLYGFVLNPEHGLAVFRNGRHHSCSGCAVTRGRPLRIKNKAGKLLVPNPQKITEQAQQLRVVDHCRTDVVRNAASAEGVGTT